MKNIKKDIQNNSKEYLAELFDFLEIPSISTDSQYAEHVQAAALFTKQLLDNAGVENIELIQTDGHPLVYGEKILSDSYPTVLVYGHFDVQPADPIDQWDSDPFRPEVRDNKVYARGASDDKGQLHMSIKAFEVLSRAKKMHCNVKFLLEGEEEIGSPHIAQYIAKNKEKLHADVVLVTDTALIDKDTPTITTSLRGMTMLEVEVKSLKRDVHSGVYGGAVHNPIHVLSKLLGDLEDENFQISIPGFYDDVLDIDEKERKMHSHNASKFMSTMEDVCCGKSIHETGYSEYESTTMRPAIDVNGISGGYAGEGHKSVIPEKATAKLSVRLAPGQKPAKIADLVEQYIVKNAPSTVEVTIKKEKESPYGIGDPVRMSIDSREFAAAKQAFMKVYRKKTVPVWCGGSIPVVSVFKHVLGIPSILIGFGLETDNIHSPNEHFHIDNYMRGIETLAWFYTEYAKIEK